MERISPIRQGSRVYLLNCVAGDPGCVLGFTPRGKCVVQWFDLGITTEHAPDTLVIDESFKVTQLGLDFGEIAA